MRSVPLVILSFSLLALTSCTTVREKFSGERYGEPVPGPRRPPILNVSQQPRPTLSPTAPIEKITPGTPQKAAAQPTPYDQYDAQGTDVSRKNYIAEWLSDDSNTSSNSGRKLFKGNLQQAAIAPAPPTPVSEPAIAPVELKKRPEPIVPTAPAAVAPPAQTNEPIAVETPPAVAPTPATKPVKGNGVIIPLSRSGEGEINITELAPAAGGAEAVVVPVAIPKAEPLAQYAVAGDKPSLTHVPQKPRQFDIIRQEKDQQLKQLERDHDDAMENKSLLDAEPTDLSLPEIEDTIEEIESAIESPTPLFASNTAHMEEASPSAGQ